jgi:hypothetical protein
MTQSPAPSGAGLSRICQVLGRLPWFALFPLRERRLRPRLDIAALLSCVVAVR